MDADLYKDLLVELECPICTNYMAPPILQCTTGHSFCAPCRKKLPLCALCQGKFTDSRNISLEGLAMKMRYPCINKSMGCKESLAFSEKDNHELQCPWKLLYCPIEDCDWKGKLQDVSSHWGGKKLSIKPFKTANVCHLNIKSSEDNFFVNLVKAYSKVFWFKCRTMNKNVYWAVQLLGNAKDAENYYFEIEIIKPDKPKKRILLSNYCQGIDLEETLLFNKNICSSQHLSVLSSMTAGDDDVLIYYFRIIEVAEENKPSSKETEQKSKQKAPAAVPPTTSAKPSPIPPQEATSGNAKQAKKKQQKQTKPDDV